MPHHGAMAEEHPHHEYYWIGGAVAAFAALWYLGDVILPFVIGAAIAYLLDPVADRLERWGCSRALATALVMIGAALVIALALLLVIPLFLQQTVALVAAIPEIVRDFRAFVEMRAPDLFDATSPARAAVEQALSALQGQAGQFAQGILASVNSLIGVILFLVVTPVVAFYLLLDWDRMVRSLDNLLPRRDAGTIRQLAGEIDRALAGFVRGQFTVCVILGVFYALALMLVGLDFAIVIGLVAGLLTFIPWVGSITGGVLSIGLALFQFWAEPWRIALVAVIFVAGQFAEGNVLTPKLVGGSVGLHPVWLLFALSVFGALFGFVGLLVAVPVAAMLGVLVRYAIARYREGRFYRGGGDGAAR
jgi:predicted PurR-regulated permease PerM